MRKVRPVAPPKRIGAFSRSRTDRELETYWDVTVSLEYPTNGPVSALRANAEEIGKMLASLAQALRLKAVP